MRAAIGIVTQLLTIPLMSSVMANPSQQAIASKEYLYPILSGEALRPEDPPGAELTERGRHIRGVYAPVSKLANWHPRQLLSWIRSIGADAIVMDVKDDKGRVTFTRELPGAEGSPHGLVPRMAEFLQILKDNDIYTIGRIVCFKDDIYTKRNRGAAIVDRRTQKPWRDRANMAWLDPYSLDAHKYITSIAEAAEAIGFDEVQLDYVRFPVDGLSRYARFPNKEEGVQRYQAIALLLARVDKTISLPLSIDVFGLTAHRPGDKQGLGQSLEHLSPYIDAISPMLYIANWPKEVWENGDHKKVYSLVSSAVQNIRARLDDAIAVRPLLQGFAYRAADFGVPFLNIQIDAARDAGSSGYLFWNQGGHYTTLSVAWRRIGDMKHTRETEEKEACITPPPPEPEQDAGTSDAGDASVELCINKP